jgi:DNA-binding transcriptional MerR regulator
LDGPIKAGRGAAYTEQHIARLEEIKALQAQGHMLSEISSMVASEEPQTRFSSTAWWQHAISEDVLVWTKADVSPWRMKQIRAALDEIARRLAEKED